VIPAEIIIFMVGGVTCEEANQGERLQWNISDQHHKVCFFKFNQK
jgi:hypothetical protein